MAVIIPLCLGLLVCFCGRANHRVPHLSYLQKIIILHQFFVIVQWAMKPNMRRSSKLAMWSYAKSLILTILYMLLSVENLISVSFICSCLTEASVFLHMRVLAFFMHSCLHFITAKICYYKCSSKVSWNTRWEFCVTDTAFKLLASQLFFKSSFNSWRNPNILKTYSLK